MSDALIGGIFTVVGSVLTIIVSHFLSLNKDKEKDSFLKQLQTNNSSLKKKLEELNKTLPKNFEIIKNVDDVLQSKILPLIREESAEHKLIQIENFGLDLHSVMPWMENQIIHSEEFDNIRVEIKSLIINPESEYLKKFIDGKSNISSNIIASSIAIANDLNKHEDLDRFCLEMRQYDLPPIFHGFLLNNEHLFVGFTEILEGKIIGGIKPYLHLWKDVKNTSEFNSHYFKFFKNWFDYYWNISKEVANVKK